MSRRLKKVFELLILLFCSGIVLTQLVRIFSSNKFFAFWVFLGFILLTCTIILLTRTNIKKPLLFLMVIGFVLRFVSIASIPNQQVSDFQIYHELASAIANGFGYSYVGYTGLNEDLPMYLNQDQGKRLFVPTNYRPAGYPIVLGILYKIFKEKPLMGKVLNLIMGLLGGLFLYLIALKIDQKLAFRVTLFWMAYPSYIFASNLLSTEIIYSSILLMSIWFLTESIHKNKVSYIILSGFLLGYCCLIRPYIFVLPCAIFAVVLSVKNIRRIILISILFIFVFSLPLISWGIRNYIVFDKFTPMPNNGGPTLNIRTHHMKPTNPDKKYMQLENKLKMINDEFEINRVGMSLVKRRLILSFSENPLNFVFNHMRRNFFDAWQHDLSIVYWCSKSEFYETVRDGVSLPLSNKMLLFLKILVSICYLSMTFLAVMGVINIKRLNIWNNPALIMLFSYFIINVVFLSLYKATTRYHYESMIIIFILAGNGIAYLKDLNLSKKVSRK